MGGEDRTNLVLNLGVEDAEVVVATSVARLAARMEHLADGPVVAGLHGLVVRRDGGEDLPSLDIVSLAEATLPVGDVATSGAKGVEDLGKLAVGEQTIQATRA